MDSKTTIIVAVITVVGGILTAIVGNWDKIFSKPDPGVRTVSAYSTTCRYSNGPKSGQTEYFRPGLFGLTPAQVGGPCHDGAGSWGTAIPD